MQQASNDLRSSRSMVLKLLILVVTSFYTLTSLAQSQATYPSKPIKLVLPLAVGSAVDLAARIVTQKMSANMGQSFVIENIPGAAGLIGAEKVAKATADGYTLGGFNDGIITMGPNLNPNVPYDPLKDFAYISLVTTVEAGLVVPSNSPYKNIGQLLRAANQSPGKINYSSGGNGSPQHIGVAMIEAQSGVKMFHIPYKGVTQAVQDVAAGQVDFTLLGLATAAGLVKGGKLNLIGVPMKSRHPQFPDVPTFAESGFPDFEFSTWFVMAAPSNTSPEILRYLHKEIQLALSDKETFEKLQALGLTPKGLSPIETNDLTKANFIRYGKIIKDAKIKAD